MRLKKLLRKDIEPRCTYCAHGTFRWRTASASPAAAAAWWTARSHCRSFRYDPLRRIPPKPAALRGHFHRRRLSHWGMTMKH